jgi:hypothetical protein
VAHSHRSILLKELKATFPELRAILNAEGGLLHPEMSRFAEFVRDAIRCRDEVTVKEALAIAGRHYRDGALALRNALAVSFVEHLSFRNDPWAWELLPATLKDVYLALLDRGLVPPPPSLAR